MTTSNVAFSSILIENKQNRILNSKENVKNSNSGIDFKNDSVLVSAKKDYTNAQNAETMKEFSYNSANMEYEHLCNNYSNIFNQYQLSYNNYMGAKAASEKMVTYGASVLQLLTKSNDKVAGIEKNKTDAETVVSSFAEQIKVKSNEKSKLLSEHDGKISNLQSKIDNYDSNIGRLNSALRNCKTTISNANTQITDLEASIVDDMSEEEKNSIHEQIDALKSNISEAEKRQQEIQNEIALLEENKAKVKEQLNIELAARSKTDKKLSEEIVDLENQMAKAQENLNSITAQLAEAVLVQTGLSLQQATASQMIKEAQLYESSAAVILATTEAKLERAEADKTVANTELETNTDEYNTAKDNRIEKENIYNFIETDTKASYEKKEKEQTTFMA